MSTPASLLADAYNLLLDDLVAHLQEADELADEEGEWSAEDQQAARRLIGDLVLLIRALLIEHELPKNSSECKTCASAWPCPVITTLHAVLKDPEHQFVALVLRRRALDDD